MGAAESAIHPCYHSMAPIAALKRLRVPREACVEASCMPILQIGLFASSTKTNFVGHENAEAQNLVGSPLVMVFDAFSRCYWAGPGQMAAGWR
jgi:hypothetical protein